jgi:Terminase RNaseH-like domain
MAQRPQIQMMPAQAEFITDTSTKFVGLMGGYRSGKTFVCCMKAIQLAMLNVGYNGMLMEPTQGLLNSVLVPQMRDCLDAVGFIENKTYYCYTTSTDPKFVLIFPSGKVTIFLRASENYQRIVGMSLAWFVADEFDTSGYEICNQAWQKMCARLTKGNVIQGCVASTKEGFQWCYKYFVEGTLKLKEEGKPIDRRMIDINVMDNPFVDDGYVELQRSQLSPKQFEAFIENKFVNFSTGSVYYCYDRIQSRSLFEISKHPQAPLHIGIDFNVGKMAAIVAVVTGGQMHVVDEFFGSTNTLALIEDIQKRYPRRDITCYVDASGNADKTNANITDIQLLKGAFGADKVKYKTKNPLVADRVGVVNTKLLAADKKTRQLLINDRACPKLSKDLEAQGYKDGKPDKSNDVDHLPDALGYFVTYLFPPIPRATMKILN